MNTTALTRRVANQLPTTWAGRAFLVVATVDAGGRGLFLAGSVVFYTRIIGLSSAQVGLGLSLAGLCGFCCTVPIGRLADRLGSGRTLIMLQVMRGMLFLVYPFVSSFWSFLLVACLIGSAEAAVFPVMQSVGGSLARGNSFVTLMALMTTLRNVAYGLSAATATVVIALHSRDAFRILVVVVGLIFLATAALLLSATRAAELVNPAVADVREKEAAGVQAPHRGWFASLTVLNGILFLHAVILSVGLPLWILDRTSAPPAMVGAVTLVNTVGAVLLQVRLSRGAETLHGAAVKQRLAGVALAGCCVLTLLSAHAGPVSASIVLVLAVCLLTLAELWQSAGAWGVSFALAPAERRSYYLSIYGLGSVGTGVVGPLLLALVVADHTGLGWLVLVTVLSASAVAVPSIARRLD